MVTVPLGLILKTDAIAVGPALVRRPVEVPVSGLDSPAAGLAPFAPLKLSSVVKVCAALLRP